MLTTKMTIGGGAQNTSTRAVWLPTTSCETRFAYAYLNQSNKIEIDNVSKA